MAQYFLMAELTKVGRYQLKGVFGRGAMGVVYEGLDPSLNRRVAVKTIRRARQSPFQSRWARASVARA